MREQTDRDGAAPLNTPVTFEMPDGACDCHAHIHGDPERFPFFPGRVYTPESALPGEMAVLHATLHVQRVVIVTSSVYGTDNAATLHGLRARGADARGVAVIDGETSESELDTLGGAGVRGMRLNFATTRTDDPAAVREGLLAAVERARRRDWHVQLYVDLTMVPAIRELVIAAPVPIVFDHFGGARAELGPAQPGFAELLELVRSGAAYVKLSGVYRISALAPNYTDVAPLAGALIAANSERVLWGTDWPHPDALTPPGRRATDVTPHLRIDDGRLLNLLPAWAPDPATRKQILVDNPVRLYGF